MEDRNRVVLFDQLEDCLHDIRFGIEVLEKHLKKLSSLREKIKQIEQGE